MSPPAPPGKETPRSAKKPRRKVRRISSKVCYDERLTQVANVADPLETKSEFVCRLLHQKEFPRQVIRDGLVHYEALLKRTAGHSTNITSSKGCSLPGGALRANPLPPKQSARRSLRSKESLRMPHKIDNDSITTDTRQLTSGKHPRFTHLKNQLGVYRCWLRLELNKIARSVAC